MKIKRENLKKIIIAVALITGFVVFSTAVSADDKIGCVDIFDAKNQTQGSITLQWDRGIGADGYVISRQDKTTNGSYIEIATIDNSDTTQIKDTNVQPGSQYNYKIQSYTNYGDKKIYSKAEAVKTASSPVKVKDFSLVIQNQKSITLKWGEVKGATGYTLYRMDYTSNGEYKKICDVKDVSKYTDKGLKPSHKYYYIIKAYKEISGERSYSAESDIIKTATNPEQVKNLKAAKRDKTSIKLSWDKSPNATGYVIYRMTTNDNDYEGEWLYDDINGWYYSSKVGKYIKYAVINDGDKTTYTNKNLNEQQNYNYRVVPYYKADGKYYYGDYRTLITGTVTDTPEPTVFSRDKRVMAKWYHVSGADGYAVYLSESKSGPYKLQGTTEDNIFLTKQKTADKTYYVRVCAYYTAEDGTKIFSNYKTQSVKCKKTNMVDKYNVGTTYIEIDIDMQHMWYFEKGKLVVSTPVVTGLKYYRDTTTGLYDVYYKKSPATLEGETWETDVTYWMAVTYDGIGIHDSLWRYDYEYGGSTYTYDGSHGCINTPYYNVEKMYELVEIGTPVVIYEKSRETEDE
ncbi:MAG: L,D-transpeptidase family protein [Acutalibacteraceae bacterium]|nr:L,D-transpeptidase family protein [Acutalibacteraceae bacterium]